MPNNQDNPQGRETVIANLDGAYEKLGGAIRKHLDKKYIKFNEDGKRDWDATKFWKFCSQFDKDVLEFKLKSQQSKIPRTPLYNTLKQINTNGLDSYQFKGVIATLMELNDWASERQFIDTYVMFCSDNFGVSSVDAFKEHSDLVAEIKRKYALETLPVDPSKVKVEIPEQTASLIAENNAQENNKNKSDLLSPLIDQPLYKDTPTSFKNSGDDISLSPLHHIDIPLQGRKKEMGMLNGFIASDAPFEIFCIVAPSGAGKTRLVSEWYRNHAQIKDWQSGFIEKEKDLSLWDAWKNEEMTCDTLIVVDYIHRFKDNVRLICEKGANHAQHYAEHSTEGGARYRSGAPKLRLLILDHTLPNTHDFRDMNRHQKDAFADFAKSYASPSSPLYLGKIAPQDHENMIKGIIAEVSGLDKQSEPVSTAYRALQQMDKQGTQSSDDESVKFANFPLFAILIAKKLTELVEQGGTQSLTHWQRRDLIDFYFSDQNKRRIPWRHSGQLGVLVGATVSAATVLQSLAYDVVFDILYHPDTASILDIALLPDEKALISQAEGRESLLATCNHIVSSKDEKTLVRYQPDILGETFVLRFVADYEYDFKQRTGIAAVFFAMLCNQGQEQGDSIVIYQGIIEFAIRTARNLGHDDIANPQVEKGWQMLALLLNPQHYSSSASIRLTMSIALVNMVTMVKQEFRDKLDVLGPSLNTCIDFVNIDWFLAIFKVSGQVDKESINQYFWFEIAREFNSEVHHSLN